MNVNWPIAQMKWQNEQSAFVFDSLETMNRRLARLRRKGWLLALPGRYMIPGVSQWAP